jgi:hypothetical protein
VIARLARLAGAAEGRQSQSSSQRHCESWRRASTNQMTHATILNIAKIRVKDDTTIMISNLPSRHKLYGQIGNKTNIRDMKRVRTKCALSSNIKRGTIGNINSAMEIRRMQSRKMRSEESCERKRQNLDTKDQYLEKEQKVVLKWKTEKQ